MDPRHAGRRQEVLFLYNSAAAQSLQKPQAKEREALTVLFCEEPPRFGQERHREGKKKRSEALKHFSLFNVTHVHVSVTEP